MRKPATGAASITKESITCPVGPDGFEEKASGVERTVYEPSVARQVARSPRWHSKAPASVSLDMRLSAEAVRAYDVMGLKTKGVVCSLGVRHLGKLLGKKKSAAAEWVQELVEHGHVAKLPRKNGQRARYRMMSAAYMKTCVTCHRFVEEVRESGECWVCAEAAAKRRA
jgi:hypothetical protein